MSLETRELRKAFGPVPVLAGVNLRVETGESVVIIGRSGCGKSILLKHLIGLLQPDHGTVLIDGEDIAALSERQLLQVRRKFGMLFQGAALFDSLTVAENVGFVFDREGKLAPAEIARRVDEALDLVELGDARAKRPAELSGGMRKRVGLARAIVYRPQILLFDEPTTGLDPVGADSIDQLIQRINGQLNVTTVVVTHDLRSARRHGRRILMLHNGRIYAAGTPDVIFHSADPVIHRFVEGVADPHPRNHTSGYEPTAR
jgi:phospholipid/cholesterol/gamma-HCH transport system ATP-binding protein